MINDNILLNMACNNLFQLDSWSRSTNQDNLDTIVIAEQIIPSGFQSLPTSRPIPIKKILKPFQPKHLIKAYISELGVVSTRENIDWIHLIRLAENCFEQNVLIHWNVEKKCLIATIIKSIEVGEELKAWFTSDLLNFLNIPFLSPSNIVNISNYQCSFCESTFSQPNPLKIHLAFDCPIQSSNRLLSNLHQSSTIPLTANFNSSTNASIAALLFSNNNSNISNSTPIVSQLNSPLMIPVSQSSSPLSTHPKMNGNSSSSSSSLSSLSSRGNCDPRNTKETPETQMTNISPQPTTVVTSTLFGTKEPRSHICVFCGKLYTRKYGLKIHLRTHTGHKPLSCRFCGRPFSDPSNLNKHIRLHSQHHSGSVSSPYKCKKCPKILVRRRDLERHLKSRHKL